MKYLLFIQGNGRGHLSQALTLKEKLEKNGHQILAAVIGSKAGLDAPRFFKEQFSGPIIRITSPYFITDKKGRGINLFASVWHSILDAPTYFSSLKKIHQLVLELKPDILINCYEPLAGLYYRFYKVSRPMFCIAHQYFIKHPSFKFPNLSPLAKTSFRLFNLITAPYSAKRIALSFTNEDNRPEKNLLVCPPLIRLCIKNSQPQNLDYILTYILNPGYGDELIDWCNLNPNYKVEAFREQLEEEKQVAHNLIFHALSGEKFIDRLINCSAYASTGGFESICEAAYLQKNILTVPTQGHFEQKCNVADGQRANLAHTDDHFDLSLLTMPKTKTHTIGQLAFKEWVDNYDNKILNILELKNTL